MMVEEEVLSALHNEVGWAYIVKSSDTRNYRLEDMTVYGIVRVYRPYNSWVIPVSVKELADEVRRIQACTKFKMLAIELQRVEFGDGRDYAAVIVGMV